MRIIKDNQITEDSWEFKDDETGLSEGNSIISLKRLEQNGAELLNRSGSLGVRLLPGDALDGLIAYLPKLALVELYFPELSDGRLFSLAWLLRNRHGFKGEIRAAGHFLPEQVFYLSRVGVNSFKPEKPENLPVTLTNLKDFSVKYQPSVN